MWTRIVLLLGIAQGAVFNAIGQSGADADLEFFERRIRPMLVDHCHECHGPTKHKGGLRLDTPEGWRKGGDSGPALVPGQPETSLLIRAVQWTDPELQMPPRNRLSASQTNLLAEWIRRGAVAPNPTPPRETHEPGSGQSPGTSGSTHWAYAPPQHVDAPATRDRNWARRRTDLFILAGMETHGLAPSPDADRATWCRRVHFDLTGLPPAQEVIEAFVRDPRPDAEARLVDQLLGSPAFGERWARHWFDVARFGESVTLRGLVFREAWRYRDYVIDAWNSDVPFDRFVTDQLAGDLDTEGSVVERQRRCAATTFLAMGNSNLEEQDKRQLEMDVIDEQLEVIGKAFLGQTVGCARCHDHKFDPITTREYYALAGILGSTRLLKHANVSEWIDRPLPLDPDAEASFARAEQEIEQLRKSVADLKARRTAGDKKDAPATPPGDRVSEDDIRNAEAALKQRIAQTPQRPRYMGPQEGAPTDLAIHRRGNPHQLGAKVPRGVLDTAFRSPMPEIPEDQSGRRELAAWIVHPDNPLTHRVYVNRVWHWLFGTGLVRSVDNFGTTGDAPSHPALLDDLALRFGRDVSEGGFQRSTKALVRELVLSRTYRQTSAPPPEQDPANRWLSVFPLRRLDAESLRDAVLTASGNLDPTRPDGPAFPASLSADFGFELRPTYRSVYIPMLRNAVPEFLSTLDGPDPGRVVGARPSSTVAPQALLWLNHPWIRSQARAAAARLLAQTPSVPRENQLHTASMIVLGRLPNAGELRVALHHLDTQPDTDEAWTELMHAWFASVDFSTLR